jgi:hypothetical protein
MIHFPVDSFYSFRFILTSSSVLFLPPVQEQTCHTVTKAWLRPKKETDKYFLFLQRGVYISGKVSSGNRMLGTDVVYQEYLKKFSS